MKPGSTARLRLAGATILLSALALLASCDLFGKPSAPGSGKPADRTPSFRMTKLSRDADFLRVDYECANLSYLSISVSKEAAGTMDPRFLASIPAPGSAGYAYLERSRLPEADYLYLHFAADAADITAEDIYVHHGFDLDGSSEPPPPPVTASIVAKEFWGRWVDLSTQEQWYIGAISARRYQWPWSENPEDREIFQVYRARESAPASTPEFFPFDSYGQPSANLVTLTTKITDVVEMTDSDGQKHFFKRSGGKNVLFSGNLNSSVPVESAGGARALGRPGKAASRSLGTLSNLSVQIQNALNAADAIIATTDENSDFSALVGSGQSDYLVTPLLDANDQPVATAEESAYSPVLVRVEADGQDIGTVTSSLRGPAFKAAFNPSYWIGGSLVADEEKEYLIDFTIENSGDADLTESADFVIRAPSGVSVKSIDWSSSYGDSVSFTVNGLAAGDRSILQLYARFSSSSISSNWQDLSFAFSTALPGWETWQDSAPVRVYENRLLSYHFTELQRPGPTTTSAARVTIISPFDTVVASWSPAFPLSRDSGRDYLVFVRAEESVPQGFPYVIDLDGGPYEYSYDLANMTLPHPTNSIESPYVLYDGTSFVGELLGGESVCFRIQASGDLQPLVVTELGSSTEASARLSWSAPNAQEARIVRTDLATGASSAEISAPAVQADWTDAQALPGRLYRYDLRGFHDEKGYTPTVSRVASVSGYAKTASAAAPWADAKLLPDGPYATAAADTARGLLWVASPAGLSAVNAASGLVVRSLPYPSGLSATTAISEIDIDLEGDPVIFERTALKFHRFSGGSWTTTTIPAAIAPAYSDIAADFAYDDYHDWFWIARLGTAKVLALDATGLQQREITATATTLSGAVRLECDGAGGSLYVLAAISLSGEAASARISRYDATGTLQERIVGDGYWMDWDGGRGVLVALANTDINEYGAALSGPTTTACAWDPNILYYGAAMGAARFDGALVAWYLYEYTQATPEVLLCKPEANLYKAFAHRSSEAVTGLRPDGSGGFWVSRGGDEYHLDNGMGLTTAFRAVHRLPPYGSGAECAFIGTRTVGSEALPVAILGNAAPSAKIAAFSADGWMSLTWLATAPFMLAGSSFVTSANAVYDTSPPLLVAGGAYIWPMKADATLGEVAVIGGAQVGTDARGGISTAAYSAIQGVIPSPTFADYTASASGLSPRGAEITSDFSWLAAAAYPQGGELPDGARAVKENRYVYKLIGADASGRHYSLLSGISFLARTDGLTSPAFDPLPFAFIVRVDAAGKPDAWWGGFGDSIEESSAVLVDADGTVWAASTTAMEKFSLR